MRPIDLKLLSAIGLLVPALAGAAGGELGAPSFDTLFETTYRQVTWDDFRGKGIKPPGWNRWDGGTFAHIATGIALGRFKVEDRQDGDGWIAVPVGIRPYAVMDKNFSSMAPGSRNPGALAHEQIHFDIAEIVARRLAVNLARLEGRGGSRNQAHQDLDRRIRERFLAGQGELDELQSRYDGETDNGSHKKKQKKWAAAVPEMFREATEALAAMIAAGSGVEEPGR